MKQKDIVLIIVIVFISGLLSFFVSKQLFASPDKRSQEVEVVLPISSQWSSPDRRFFNDKSIDPTRTITITDNNNTEPFSGGNSNTQPFGSGNSPQ